MLSIQKRIVVLTGFYITFFAGAVFGWGPMQLMLEMDGDFSWRCTPEQVAAGVICQSQTISLLRIPLIAGLCSILSPMLGHIADEYGSHVLMQVMSVFGVVGISLVMTASGTGVDWILFVAFSFLYLMLMSGSIMITKTGLLFDNSDARRRVISVLNTLLDAGSMTYLILLKILQGIEGATFLGVMGGYLGIAATCFGLTSYQWVRISRQLEKEFAATSDTNNNADKDSAAAEPAGGGKETKSATFVVRKKHVPSRKLRDSDRRLDFLD